MRPSLKLLAYWTWAVPVLAAVLPSVSTGHSDIQTDARSSILELDFQDSYAQATFAVPCVACLGQQPTSRDDDSLTFNFKAYASEQPCGVANITLNGVYLAQEWNGNSAQGSGSFSGVPDLEKDDWFHQHDLHLEWESACLFGNESEGNENAESDEDVAQVLTLNVKSIDGKALAQSSGFTISFKPLSPPELLRLSVVPDPKAIEQEFAEDWREPPTFLRLVEPVDNEGTGEDSSPSFEFEFLPPPSLEDEIRELKRLEIQAQELKNAIREKKHHIDSQLKKEVKSFKEELKQCDSITCVFRTIAHKAHGAVRIIYIRFKPPHRHHGPPPGHDHMGRPHPDPYANVWHASTHNQAPEGPPSPPAVQHHGRPPHGNGTHPPPPPPPPPPPHHGHHPPPPPHHGPPPPHHGPPPPHHGHHPPPPWVIALKAILGISCLACLFSLIRSRCMSVRTRVDRAARREERRTARAYRRAARRHAWKSWWSRSRRDHERMEDYEEKRALIQEQESVLEEAMQEELRQLRAAHGVVNSLVTAEEGRSTLSGPYTPMHSHACFSCSHQQHHHHSHPHQHPHFHPSSLAELPGIQSRPLSRTNSLPDYRSETSNETEPPAYEDEEDSSDVVVNGFRQYTPSTTSSGAGTWDETPESSVIDVSPRPSSETMRTFATVGANPFASTGDGKN